ncbi:MAG: acyltransferase domain-containing protein [Ruminococcus sp.]
MGEEEYQENKLLYEKDRALFYEKILLEKDYRLVFLYYLCRMGAETYDAYEKRGISREIFRDTFYDLTFWCENCFLEYGEYGIDEYDWFFRHMKLTIFRLGRMQFEIMDSRWNFTAGERMVKKGDPIISIHIPQGEKLTLESVRESIIQGMAFWGKEMPYLCHSWLLYPGLKDILPEKSNIIMFQNQFQIVETDWDEREAEWRIWGKVQRNLNVYSENTSLQRAAKKYLKSGKVLGSGLGILKPEYFL